MTKSLGRFLRDESGATAVEYGLIAALVCLAIVGALTSFAGSTIDMYQYVVDATTSVMP